jgi:hypothetical protein
MTSEQHKQDSGQDEERALRAVVEHGTEAEIDADTGRALARRRLVVEGGGPDAPTLTATHAGRALVDERRQALHTFIAGRGIVLQVLRNDHPEWWTRAELLKEITDFPTVIVEGALGRLVEAGAVVVDGERVKASPCAQYLDALELIGV